MSYEELIQDEGLLAIVLFQRIRNSFPRLEMTLTSDGPDGLVELLIPMQKGLNFSLRLFRKRNELYLETARLRTAWAPLEDHDVRELYVDTVIGIIRGDYEIRESFEDGICISSSLEVTKDPVNQAFSALLGRDSFFHPKGGFRFLALQ